MKSLLFGAERPKQVMQPDMISDLKIDLLLPNEVSRFLLLKPEKENILARNDMFSRMIESGSAISDVTELWELLSQASLLYKALNRATCEKAETYIFPFLFKYITRFSEKAAKISGYGERFEDFSELFRSICESKDFREASERSTHIIALMEKASTIYIKTTGDHTSVLSESKENITRALTRCASELGITVKQSTGRGFALQKSVAEAMARLMPDDFGEANEYYLKYRYLVSGEIFEYLEELTFIKGILEFTHEATEAGIPHSFPRVTEEKKMALSNVYDVTLLRKEGTVIVPNDVDFSEKEPFYYLTGANGGGKTTYLRALGVASLFFLAGAPVFCDGGESFVFDSVFTHFPRDERFEGSGRFFDEIRRVKEIIEAQSGNSIVLLNETYATTGEDKALEYTAALASDLYDSGCFGLYITHQHETSGSKVPFLGVMIDETDSNRRTYRIEKRRLPPRSFAKDILEKYGLTPEALAARFPKQKG